ncbi:MAG: tetratricopeptide repeat protein [Myxococcota bacterium]
MEDDPQRASSRKKYKNTLVGTGGAPELDPEAAPAVEETSPSSPPSPAPKSRPPKVSGGFRAPTKGHSEVVLRGKSTHPPPDALNAQVVRPNASDQPQLGARSNPRPAAPQVEVPVEVPKAGTIPADLEESLRAPLGSDPPLPGSSYPPGASTPARPLSDPSSSPELYDDLEPTQAEGSPRASFVPVVVGVLALLVVVGVVVWVTMFSSGPEEAATSAGTVATTTVSDRPPLAGGSTDEPEPTELSPEGADEPPIGDSLAELGDDSSPTGADGSGTSPDGSETSPEGPEASTDSAASAGFVEPAIPTRLRRIGVWQRRQRARELIREARSAHARRAYPRAENLWRDSLAHEPESADASAGLARTLARLARVDEALEWAKRAVRLDDDPRYRELAGDLLLDLRREDDALAQYRAGLHVAPNDARLRSRVHRLRNGF